jgi:hypothetical protein
VWTPNAWNAATFARDVPGLVAKAVHHPVLVPDVLETNPAAPLLTEVAAHRDAGDYVFYTIGEFSGRKGIDILIRSYLKAFTNDDAVVLVIKTHGSVGEDVARHYIDRHATHTSPKILLDYTRWSDDDIHRLHELGDTFVTFTRSEGHGLGACHAALHGKHVIMTAYGGQLDYLAGIDWVPYTLVPASFCSAFDPAHEKCVGRPWCRHFPFFIPALQRWGLVSDDDAIAALRSAHTLRKQGQPLTAQRLRESFGANAVAGALSRSIGALELSPQSRRPLITSDPYNLPASAFAPQAPFTEPFLPKKRPSVLIITCAGGGNFGDDSYEKIHLEELATHYDITITHPTMFIAEDGRELTEEFLHLPPKRFDHIVIGGGGIINRGETRSTIFTKYLPWCMANNVPISLISVGVAFEGEARRLDTHTSLTWLPLLEYASLVSVRSFEDAAILRSLMTPARHHRLRVAADVVYKMREYHPNGGSRKFVVFCPTNFMSTRFPDVVDLIRKRCWENPGARLVFLPLDGQMDANVYPAPFVTEELARFRRSFPDAIVYTGRLGRHAREAGIWGSMSIALTLDDIMNIFKDAAHIITGRYHGLVAARALGIPFDIGTANVHKLVREAESAVDPITWRRHYDELRRVIDGKPIYNDKDPSQWTEDERNTALVDELTQPSDPEAWVATIGYLQGMTNKALRQRRMAVAKE